MARLILIEEFHVSVRVPRELSTAQTRAIRTTLDSTPFRSHFGHVVRAAFRRWPALNHVRVTITR